jgi:uncharacterized protein (TIGR04255 family)
LNAGTLIARIIRRTSNLGFPADLDPRGLVLINRFKNKESREHAIVDCDHFVEGIMPLKFSKFSAINEQLETLHAEVKSIFEATVTPYARTVWA